MINRTVLKHTTSKWAKAKEYLSTLWLFRLVKQSGVSVSSMHGIGMDGLVWVHPNNPHNMN